MGDNKALGLDGNSATLFKEAWDVIVVDVTKAIKEFFTNGVLLKELNHTIIALIPKSLSGLVSLNQSACVPRIRISNYILLTQELIHNYHFDRGTPRCAFKVDIQKAYDTVDWNLLHDVLVIFEFHSRMIRWIIEARNSNCLTYHQYCTKLNIINLCFADDLFLFAHGDVNSAQVIMDTLEEFKNASGLTPSLPKSTGYFCNVLNYVKLDILNILPFEEGKIHVKYLGVPLTLSRLLYYDCSELIKKVKRRISDWKNNPCLLWEGLSSFVLFLLLCIFIGELCKGKAKVPWEDVCLPKKEGGLEDDECSDVGSSLEVAYLSYWSFTELMFPLMDSGVLCLMIPLSKFFYKVLQSAYLPFQSVWAGQTHDVRCNVKTYGVKPSVDLLQGFLNLGTSGNWLTLSNTSDPSTPKAVTKLITHIKEGGGGDVKGSSPFTVSVNKVTLVNDTQPLTFVLPSQFAKNTIDSNDTPSEKDDVILVDRVVVDKANNQNVGTS
nr:hypothetical protein [Tanacetum cinerariifolium]